MMYLKIMSPQDADDDDPAKDCTVMLLPEDLTHSVAFKGPTVDRPIARVEITNRDRSTQSYDIHGNAYLMDCTGLDILAFGVAGVGLDAGPLVGRERHRHDVEHYTRAPVDDDIELEATSNLNNDPLLAMRMGKPL